METSIAVGIQAKKIKGGATTPPLPLFQNMPLPQRRNKKLGGIFSFAPPSNALKTFCVLNKDFYDCRGPFGGCLPRELYVWTFMPLHSLPVLP